MLLLRLVKVIIYIVYHHKNAYQANIVDMYSTSTVPLEVAGVTFVVVVVRVAVVDLISAMVELGVAEGSIDRRTSTPITHCN